jgi:serine/threonine-protein kinase
MNKETWKKIEAIFDEALAVESDKRKAFVLSRSNNENIFNQVMKMLRAHDDTFMENHEGLAPVVIDEINQNNLKSIAHFKILKKVATGGMGRVYLAQSMISDVTIVVALKTIRIELVNNDLEKRFHNEKQILSKLQHKNIASLIDAGVSEDNIPYIATEWIDGTTINKYCQENKLKLKQRLRLFQQICSAVSFAHNKLIIHRDLKPDNILVDNNGQVKLLDFGIAKIIDDNNKFQTQTQIYTPDYAAPEQINGELCTAVTDVYSLGILLFEILTDNKRFNLAGLTVKEKIQAICSPAKIELKKLKTDLPYSLSNLDGALINIINKAMHVDQNRRYSTVDALSSDILNYLNNRPVTAMKDSFFYKTKMFLIRNKMASFLTTMVFVAIMVGQYNSNKHLKQKIKESEKTQVMLNFFQGILQSASPAQGGSTDITVKQMFDKGISNYDFARISDPYIKAELSAQIGTIYAQLGNPEKQLKYMNKALEYYSSHLTTDKNINAFLQLSTKVGASYGLNQEFDKSSNYIILALEKLETYKLNSVHLAEAYLELATNYKEMNRFKDIKDKHLAQVYLDKAEALVKNSKEFEVLGEIEFFKQDFGEIKPEESMAFIKKAEDYFAKGQKGEFNPNLQNARSVRANLLMQLGRYEEAAALHDVVRKSTIAIYGNDNFIGLITQADNLNILGKFDKSKALLEESLEVHKQYNLPKDPPYFGSKLYTAQVMIEYQEFEKAEKLFDENHNYFAKILPANHSYLKIGNSIKSELYLKSANAEKLKAAQTQLEDYLNEENSGVKLPMYFKYSLHIKLGNTNLYFKNFERAQQHYQQAKAITLSNPERFNQAKAYWELQTGLTLAKIKNGDIGGFESFHENKNTLLEKVSNDLWYDNFYIVDEKD